MIATRLDNSERSMRRPLLAFLLLVVVTAGASSTAFAVQTVGTPAEAVGAPRADELSLRKLEAEIAKLEGEVSRLAAVSPALHRVATLSGAIGTFLGAFAGIVVAFIGYLLNRSYRRSQEIKILQEREVNREKHDLELFKAIGEGNMRQRFAATAVLLQRLQARWAPTSDGRADNDHRQPFESKTIVEVLLAVLKYCDEKEGEVDRILGKYIADNIVKCVKATAGEVARSDSAEGRSPLADFDLQKARLADVYWADVDLRRVDLFKADLTGASLRGADLRETVLLEATLRKTVLRGARLRGANLVKADLRDAKLQGADLGGASVDGVQLEGACYDKHTIWPDGLNPADHGAVPDARELGVS